MNIKGICAYLFVLVFAYKSYAQSAPVSDRVELLAPRYDWYISVAPKSKSSILAPTEVAAFFNELVLTLENINGQKNALSERLVGASRSRPYDLPAAIQLSAHLQTMAAVAQLAGHKSLYEKAYALQWQWSAHVEAIAEIAEVAMRAVSEDSGYPKTTEIKTKRVKTSNADKLMEK